MFCLKFRTKTEVEIDFVGVSIFRLFSFHQNQGNPPQYVLLSDKQEDRLKSRSESDDSEHLSDTDS